jgi:sulfite exporter TauE/SafE
MEYLLAAFTIGLLGSFHCIGMCGPIALALPLAKENFFKRISGGIIYNLGRIVTYSILGIVFGLLGKGFVIAGYQQTLSVALGILVLLTILLPKASEHIPSLTKIMLPFVTKVKSLLAGLFSKTSYTSLFSIGLLNALLPCGLVYVGIAGAIATGSALNGGLFMAMFGFGTLPAMLTVSFAAKYISLGFRNKVRKVVPVFVATMAILLILRGLNLGIPYLSPELSKTDCTKHHCCSHK